MYIYIYIYIYIYEMVFLGVQALQIILVYCADMYGRVCVCVCVFFGCDII